MYFSKLAVAGLLASTGTLSVLATPIQRNAGMENEIVKKATARDLDAVNVDEGLIKRNLVRDDPTNAETDLDPETGAALNSKGRTRTRLTSKKMNMRYRGRARQNAISAVDTDVDDGFETPGEIDDQTDNEGIVRPGVPAKREARGKRMRRHAQVELPGYEVDDDDGFGFDLSGDIDDETDDERGGKPCVPSKRESRVKRVRMRRIAQVELPGYDTDVDDGFETPGEIDDQTDDE